ncbi:hypothetical protein DFR86_03745 [Acidianus sulfidivorans JP7]|uniref:Uncharacterized protein n=1 Tax=Acidianus sulfidivorans JP7 TaxID=619593 RepID=A0A2U9IL85_9CREN|nr:hypothetical protein [Acidianus sulfidivorans]AWR96755.1 hypothetical protein DFR86_03745 [Acidianus sulfidivorans JP7]
MTNQSFSEIKNKYEELLSHYNKCKNCIDCESCDKAEILADELLTELEEIDISQIDGNEKDDIKNILFSVSSIFNELKKG